MSTPAIHTTSTSTAECQVAALNDRFASLMSNQASAPDAEVTQLQLQPQLEATHQQTAAAGRERDVTQVETTALDARTTTEMDAKAHQNDHGELPESESQVVVRSGDADSASDIVPEEDKKLMTQASKQSVTNEELSRRITAMSIQLQDLQKQMDDVLAASHKLLQSC